MGGTCRSVCFSEERAMSCRQSTKAWNSLNFILDYLDNVRTEARLSGQKRWGLVSRYQKRSSREAALWKSRQLFRTKVANHWDNAQVEKRSVKEIPITLSRHPNPSLAVILTETKSKKIKLKLPNEILKRKTVKKRKTRSEGTEGNPRGFGGQCYWPFKPGVGL